MKIAHPVKKKLIGDILFAVIATLFIVLLCSCTTDTPRVTKVNGHTVSQMDKRFIGIKVSTKTEILKTKDQKLDDLEVEKEKREQELDLQAEERQSAVAFWAGMALLAFAPICVIIGYIVSGWKFWGGLAGVSGLLGACFWSFEHLIPYLKWPAFAVAIAVPLWLMYKAKDFSLLERLKNSKEGSIL